ncbi:hypothetical protein [Dactylosporangium darangshiense]|uniref:hypothetical protein n=1 Tax=Dactylosporangium darangshiense TaxID=579108 RepID=UPI00362B0FB7
MTVYAPIVLLRAACSSPRYVGPSPPTPMTASRRGKGRWPASNAVRPAATASARHASTTTRLHVSECSRLRHSSPIASARVFRFTAVPLRPRRLSYAASQALLPSDSPCPIHSSTELRGRPGSAQPSSRSITALSVRSWAGASHCSSAPPSARSRPTTRCNSSSMPSSRA